MSRGLKNDGRLKASEETKITIKKQHLYKTDAKKRRFQNESIKCTR